MIDNFVILSGLLSFIMDGLESAAISVLKRAVELDTKRRWTESMTCYQEGLNLLMEVIKVRIKSHLRKPGLISHTFQGFRTSSSVSFSLFQPGKNSLLKASCQ